MRALTLDLCAAPERRRLHAKLVTGAAALGVVVAAEIGGCDPIARPKDCRPDPDRTVYLEIDRTDGEPEIDTSWGCGPPIDGWVPVTYGCPGEVCTIVVRWPDGRVATTQFALVWDAECETVRPDVHGLGGAVSLP